MELNTNYPSNSKLKKEEPKAPEIAKVDLKGKASVRDKSMGERCRNLFDKRDFQDIFYHVLENVLNQRTYVQYFLSEVHLLMCS